MRTLAEIDAEIAALEAERKGLIAAERAEFAAAYQAIPISYIYTVEKNGGAEYRIGRHLTPETVTAIAELAARYPNAPEIRPNTGSAMWAVLYDRTLACRGGTIIISPPKLGGEYSFDYAPISEADIAALDAGIVPAHWMRD